MSAYLPRARPMPFTDVSAHALTSLFEEVEPLTIGLEEEVWLLDAQTLDLLPSVDELLARVESDGRFKAELPAAQVEIVTAPAARVDEAIAQLAAGRRALSEAAQGPSSHDGAGPLGLLACAGVHPFAASSGVLNDAPRYAEVVREYGPIARRQLVSSLQVHVAVGGAGRTLAVYNALREYLPEIAALAANAAIYEGRDSGLASVRPFISGLLPRQGVPPVLESWEHYAQALRTVGDPGQWWWELRPHRVHGTLEVRVPDAQTTVTDAARVAAAVHGLVAWLIARADGGDLPAPAETWRIEQNRWSAARHGVDGAMADVRNGERMPTRDRLEALGWTLPTNAASRQRAVFEHSGAPGAARALARGFLDGSPG
jgi:carboxylate-amine ligase